MSVTARRHASTRQPVRLLVAAAAVACAVVPSPAVPQAAPATRPPNIVVILADDYRADAIGVSGNRYVRTPTLDRLAAAGALLTGAYNMGGFQGAICTPSRAMLMTSLALTTVDEHLEGQATWPEQFARSGYRTFITGKWHNGAASLARVFERGRAVFVGGMANPYGVPVQDFSRGGPAPVTRTLEKHDSEVFADEALAFLREQRAGQPFLCYVAFKAPHDPRVAPPVWHDRFRATPPPAPANFLPEHPFDNGELQIRDELLLPRPRTEAAVRKELADYYASIGHLDEQIGRVLAELNRSGLAKDTIVVFSGDNGLAIGSHGLLGKQNLYEHSVRVPLILAGPGVPRGVRSEGLCYLQDVFPTLADLAGVPPIANTFGRSLRPLLDDPGAAFRPTVFTAYRDVQRAIRDGRFKLIRYPRIDRIQLFDLRADPLEREDLAGRPEHTGTVARMRAALKEEQARLGDTPR
jgi:arylsulfatase A-like enzyme